MKVTIQISVHQLPLTSANRYKSVKQILNIRTNDMNKYLGERHINYFMWLKPVSSQRFSVH